jgi:hypothetical protein
LKAFHVWPVFQRKLTEAVMQDAVVEEIVLADNLTSKQAYRFEYRRLEAMVYAGKRNNCGMSFRIPSTRQRSATPM